jgi:ferredoxin
MSANSGYSVLHDEAKCKKCGICSSICQFGAVILNDGTWSYDKNKCMGCELCVEHCPEKVLSLFQDPNKSVPLDIDLVRAEYL